MKEKKPIFWVFLGVVFLSAILLGSLTVIHLYKGESYVPKIIGSDGAVSAAEISRVDGIVTEQTIGLGGIAVYLAAALLTMPFGFAALAAGALIACLILQSYHYIIPLILIRCIALFLISTLALKKKSNWKTCLSAALLAEGAGVLLLFLYDLVFLNIGYVYACVNCVSHIGEGLVCAGIGMLILRLRQTIQADKTPQAFATPQPVSFDSEQTL